MSETAPRSAPLRGNLTQGPLTRTLLVFALPQLVGNVLQSLNGSINAIWVGQLLGDQALAATANSNILMFLLFALVFGFGMAATVRIGQAWGANDVVSARRVLGAALGLTGAISLVMASLGILFADKVLNLLATPGAAHDEALAYLRVVFIANPIATITTMIAMGLRGSGDAATPLRFMILATVLDIALNPVLILGLGPAPALGIAGSAWATVIATSIGFVAMLAWIYAKDLPLRLRGAELAWLRPRWEETRYLLARGLPMGAQMLVISGAGVVMIGLVNREGLVTAAAYGALLQIWNYIGMPAMAIGGAVSAMVAQHIGAGREDRVDAISRAGSLANLAMAEGRAVQAIHLLRQVCEGSPNRASAWFNLGFGNPLYTPESHTPFAVGYVPLFTPEARATIRAHVPEADRIEACLGSVAWAAEAIVVDGGSTDGTVELARAAGALRPIMLSQRMTAAQNRLDQLWRVAASLNPDRILERGYARIERQAGGTVTRATDARAAGALRLRFADGAVNVQVERDAKPPYEEAKPAQSDLF